MAGNTFSRDWADSLRGGWAVAPVVATGSTIKLKGGMTVVRGFGAGTFKLPTVTADHIGSKVLVIADAAQTWQNAAASTLAVLASGQAHTFVATTTSTWSDDSVNAADVPFGSPLTSNANVDAALEEVLQNTLTNTAGPTALTTAGAGTITAAALVSGSIVRTGPVAAVTDTTHTLAQILAATGYDGASGHALAWELTYKNLVGFAITIAGGTSVTVEGTAIVPPFSTAVFKVTIAQTVDGVTITGMGSHPLVNLPNAQFNTTAAASPVTPAAGILTGANNVFYAVTTSGAFGITTRTATQLFGDIPNCYTGYSFLLTIISDGDNTVTVTGGTNVTIPGTPDTAATNTTKTFLCTFTSATAMTMQVVNMGVIDATA